MTANTTGHILQRAQRGGMMVTALGLLCDAGSSAEGTGRNPTNLGRYSLICLGNEDVSTVIISTYIPNKPSNSKSETVWDHSKYYFNARGDFEALM